MIPLPFLLAIADPASGQVLPALEAFDALCGTSETVADVQDASKVLGWASFEPENGTDQASLAAALTKMPSSEFEYELLIFRENSGTRTVFALDVHAPNGEGTFECKLIDENAVAPTDHEYLAWTGKQPTDRKRSGDTEVLVWAPSHLRAPRFVAAYFVPPDSKPIFPGKGLIVSSVRYDNSQVKGDE